MKTSISFNAEQEKKKSESGTVWVPWWVWGFADQPAMSWVHMSHASHFLSPLYCHYKGTNARKFFRKRKKAIVRNLKGTRENKKGDGGLEKSRLAWLHLTMLKQISTEFFQQDGCRKSGWNSFLAVETRFKSSI